MLIKTLFIFQLRCTGSGTFPIPGVNMDVVDNDGAPVEANTKGYRIIRDPWHGMLQTL